jgi:hypothetical protein
MVRDYNAVVIVNGTADVYRICQKIIEIWIEGTGIL